MQVGSRVRLVRDVERYPHFVADEGRTGMVTRLDDDLIAVQLDDPLEGAEEWSNEVRWYAGMYEEEDFRSVFSKDVEELG